MVQPEAVALFLVDRPAAEVPVAAGGVSLVDPLAAAAPEAAGVRSRVDRPAAVGPEAAGAAFPEARPVAEVPVVAEVACRAWAACRFPDPSAARDAIRSQSRYSGNAHGRSNTVTVY